MNHGGIIPEIIYLSGDSEIGSKITANIFVKGVSAPISMAQISLVTNGNRGLTITCIKDSPFLSENSPARGLVVLENKDKTGKYIPIEWDASGFLVQIEFMRVKIPEFLQPFVVRIQSIFLAESPEHGPIPIEIPANAKLTFPPRD